MEKDFLQDQQDAANSPVSEKVSSLLSRDISLQSACRGVLNIAGALYTRIHLLGLIGAIIVLIGAFLLWMADHLMFKELTQSLLQLYGGSTSPVSTELIAGMIAHEVISPLTWLIALAGIAAGIIVFRPHAGKFIMITGISIATYALFTYWNLPYASSAENSWESWTNGGLITILVGGGLLCYTGAVMRQFNWSLYISKHLSWKAFLSFGLNARIRVYCYLAVLLFFALDCYIGNTSLLVRQALSSVVDYSALAKEAFFQENATGYMQAISIKHKLLDVYTRKHDVHIAGNTEKIMLAKTGLTKAQLQRLSDQHSLLPLVTAALKLHCLPAAVTNVVKDPYTKSPAAICKELRRANAKHAQEVYRNEVDQYWQEVNADLTITFVKPADYRHAALWKEGWDRFIDESKGLLRETEDLVPNPLRPNISS